MCLTYQEDVWHWQLCPGCNSLVWTDFKFIALSTHFIAIFFPFYILTLLNSMSNLGAFFTVTALVTLYCLEITGQGEGFCFVKPFGYCKVWYSFFALLCCLEIVRQSVGFYLFKLFDFRGMRCRRLPYVVKIL